MVLLTLAFIVNSRTHPNLNMIAITLRTSQQPMTQKKTGHLLILVGIHLLTEVEPKFAKNNGYSQIPLLRVQGWRQEHQDYGIQMMLIAKILTLIMLKLKSLLKLDSPETQKLLVDNSLLLLLISPNSEKMSLMPRLP